MALITPVTMERFDSFSQAKSNCFVGKQHCNRSLCFHCRCSASPARWPRGKRQRNCAANAAMLSGAPTTHSATTKSEYWFYQIIEVMILIPDCVRRRLQEAAEKLPKVWPCGGGKVMLKEECQTICTLCNAMCIVQCAISGKFRKCFFMCHYL